jgi:transposase
MSMWPRLGYGVPAETARVARAAFPKGTLAIRVRDAVGELFADAQFAELFAVRGRPGLSPARLVLVLILQFAEGLTDRQAADAVRGRLDWKYALGMELTDAGFDASVLSEFRARLAGDGQAERLLGLMLDLLRGRGLLRAGGRQRTDATCVRAAVRDLHRLELVIETVRAALEALAAAAPDWLAGWIPEVWYERYGQRASGYRLPQATAAQTELAATVGADGFTLLTAAYGAQAPGWLGQLPAVEVLRRVWVQQYWLDNDTVGLRDKDNQPPAGLVIRSPYDPDARYSVKRGIGWCGYKAHFTETCEPDAPHVIVHVTSTQATVVDVEAVSDLHADLAAAGLLPDVHLVDAGYVSVDGVLSARRDHDVELLGPLPPDSGWQAADPDAFDIGHFTIDWDNQQVTCPNGRISRNWRPARSRTGLDKIQVTFRHPDCAGCPDRARCTRSTYNARSITFRPRTQFEAQQAIRAQQSTQAWKDRYALRAGVEGTIAQASQRGDIHHTRYRGLAKTHLQHVLTAMALNLIRIDAWLSGIPPHGAWTSRLTHLHPTPIPT